jgi:tetratricopeptide (TPR) repeat protein
MGSFLEDKERNVIPRLRSFATTLALGELDAFGPKNQDWVDSEQNEALESRIRAWKQHRSTSFAADLVSAAFVVGNQDAATEAAEFLLADGSDAPNASKAIARSLLNREDVAANRRVILHDPTLPTTDELRKNIRSVRLRLREEPRNAILWAELSREYALLGIEGKAERAMDTAVTLGPSNRFILRSAVRLYIHIGRLGKANYVVQRAESTLYDPWLLSAAIATGSAAKKSSQLVKNGREMLQDTAISSFQKNELASAIGTLELENGKTKIARNLFRQALIDPTENTVAQTDWVLRKRHIEGLDLDLEAIRDKTPFSFESNSWGHFTAGEWKKALLASCKWLRDQPFSTRPVLLGSYVAACLLEDYGDSERIIEIGLRANPEEPILLNNLAFSYASSGDIDRAERVFDRIDPAAVKDISQQIAITATAGLLNFRRGFFKEGRTLYRQAIEEAKKRGMRKLVAVASMYLAREEILSQSSEAEKATQLAAVETAGINEPDIKKIFEKVTSSLDRVSTTTNK